MKKIICILMSLLIMGTASFAQNKETKKPVKKPAATTAKETKAAPAQSTSVAKLKKDGTPDKRYKENKATAKQVGPMKKDGKPDMRHKANKADKKAAPEKK